MIDASLALQAAVVKAVKDDAALKALIDGRIYDSVPTGAAFPYVSFGPDDALDDSDQCHAGAETFLQLDVWSRLPGRVEAKKVVARLAVVLDADLVVDGHDLIIHEVEGLRYLRDPDGVTTHGVLTLRYVTAPSA